MLGRGSETDESLMALQRDDSRRIIVYKSHCVFAPCHFYAICMWEAAISFQRRLYHRFSLAQARFPTLFS